MSASLLMMRAIQTTTARRRLKTPATPSPLLAIWHAGGRHEHPHILHTQLQPQHELTMRFARHRFFAHCPCLDPHEWHTERLHEARCAIQCADTDEPPIVSSTLGLETEDSTLLANDEAVQGLWA